MIGSDWLASYLCNPRLSLPLRIWLVAEQCDRKLLMGRARNPSMSDAGPGTTRAKHSDPIRIRDQACSQ